MQPKLQQIKVFLRQHLAIIALVIGVVLLVVSAISAIDLTKVSQTAPRPVTLSLKASRLGKRPISAITDWMTVAYISKSYSVPLPLLRDALGITAEQATRQSLKNIAKAQHKTSSDVIMILQNTILRYQGTN
jgi:hypothetical protein